MGTHYGPRLSGNKPFSYPVILFSRGEAGWWLDPSDLSTVWQDVDGTIPGAIGQPVARIDDKSGNENHFIQSVSDRRPILSQDGTGRIYLQGDGVDDLMQSWRNVDPRGSAQSQGFLGIRTDAVKGAIPLAISVAPAGGLDSSPSFPGSWGLRLVNFSTVASFVTQGTTRTAPTVISNVTSNTTYTMTFLTDIVAPSAVARVNGSQTVSSTSTQGTGTFNSYVSGIFGPVGGSALCFPGRIYQAIARFGPPLTGQEVSLVEGYINEKTGAY